MTTPTGVSVESRYTPAHGDSAAPESPGTAARWHPAKLIGLRFGFVYFVAYALMTMTQDILIIVGTNGVPYFQQFGPYRRLVVWVGAHVFRVVVPFSYAVQVGGSSGDTVFDWVQVFTLLVVTALTTAIWSIFARKRTNEARLYGVFRVLVRFALGTTLVEYGAHLDLDGSLDGHSTHVELIYRDPNGFMLRSRGFHWVQPGSFGR